ncbi:MAG: hypothetical protein AAF447_04450 [Myxococcota bacterium]
MAPPLLFAGAFAWTVPVILGLALLGAILALTREGSHVARSAEHPFVRLAALAFAIPLAQLVPLPAEWLARNPTQPLMMETWRLLGDSRSWVPYTRDPGGTQQALLTSAAVLATALAAASLPRGQRLRGVAAAALISISVAIVVHYVHAAVGSDQVYGLHSPVYTNAGLAGPILNPNHRAGIAAFGAALALAFGTVSKQRAPALVLAGVLAAAALQTQSRGVWASFGTSLLALLAWAAFRGPRDRRRKAKVTLLGSAFAVPAALWLGWSHLAAEGFDKVHVALRSLRFFVDYPVLGVGRGAFSVVQALEGNDLIRYTHPENLLAQWATEAGVMGLLVVTGSGLFLLRSLWQTRRSFEATVIAALLGLGAHELVDFSMEMPGLVVVASAVMAALPGRRVSRRRARPRPKLALAWGLTAACGLTLLLASPRPYDRAAGPVDDADARRLLRLHPLEPELVLMEARRLARSGSRDTPRWLNHAARLAPHWASPRVLSARWLNSIGRRDQAWLELAEAAKRVPTSAALPACEIIASPEVQVMEALELLRRVESADDRERTLRSLRSCLQPDDRLKLDRWAANAGDRSAAARVAAALLGRQRPAEAKRWLVLAPDDADTMRLRARATLDLGDASAALDALPDDSSTATLELRAGALLALDRSAEAERVLSTLRARSSDSTSARRNFLRFERSLKRTHQGTGEVREGPPSTPEPDPRTSADGPASAGAQDERLHP